MKNNSKTFGGFNHVRSFVPPGTRTDVLNSAARASYSLSGVLTSSSPKINGKLVLKTNAHRYTKDSAVGVHGAHSYYRTLSTGTETWDKFGDYYIDGGLLQHPDLGSFNDALSALNEVIRGSIDLSIDSFQVGQTLALAKRLLSVRKIVEHLANKTWDKVAVQRRRKSSTVRRRVYADRRRRNDRHREVSHTRDTPMKEVGGLYLEFTYGLKPTMQTIYDLVMGSAVRAGNSMHIKKPGSRFNGVQGKYKAETVDKGSSGWTSWENIYRSEYRTSFGGTYAPSSHWIESMSRLTSLNPASIAWELLPFSFVVDWFFDVGGYLRNLESALVSNLGTFEGYQTVTVRYTAELTTRWHGKDPQNLVWTGSTFGQRHRQTFSRSRITSIPLPRRPRFTADLGSHRLINAAALMSQFLGRK